MLEELDLRIGEKKSAPNPNVFTYASVCILSDCVGMPGCKKLTVPCTQ